MIQGSGLHWRARSRFLPKILSALLVAITWAGVQAHAAAAPPGLAPPLALSVDQLFSWSLDGPTGDRRNISSVKVARRFTDLDMEPGPKSRRDPRVRVLIAPDAMNDLADDLGAKPKFNLYSFTHWSQVDLLIWFGGTADRTIVVPARPWVEAAHRNGVRVIGTVFFAPVQFGGSAEKVRSFLRRDPDGSFPAARQLVEIARAYGFDGWFINAETDLGENAADRTMVDFMAGLKRAAPSSMDIIWYDSMLENGHVAWQNALNEKNLAFFEDKGRKISDGFFLNYDWTHDGLVKSAALAARQGRSRYDLFIGADLWPLRNAQPAFRNKSWLDETRERPGGPALGSIALFAPNFNFHVDSAHAAQFGNFGEDAGDASRFYEGEERLFAGDDLNMAGAAAAGEWPGIASIVVSRSTLVALPFETHFNTGHGLADYAGGKRVGGAWHDMSRQDVLPTWQFAFSPGAPVRVGYDFDDAYEGGSALRIDLARPKAGKIEIPLYLARLPVSGKVSVTINSRTRAGGYFLELRLSDGRTIDLPIESGETWRTDVKCVVVGGAKFIRRIGIAIRSGARKGAPGALLLGGMSINRGCDASQLQRN